MSTAPAVLFAGDPHGRLQPLLELARRQAPRALILLGDIEPQDSLLDFLQELHSLGVQGWFIHGNHDSDRAEVWARVAEAREHNLHGRVVDIGGLRVAGLGGVFRATVWHPDLGEPKLRSLAELEQQLGLRGKARTDIGARQRLRHASTIFPDVVERLGRLRADVLVSHEAPQPHPYGFQVLNDLARRMGVSRLFHGHHHEDIDYSAQARDMGFQAYGVGLCGVTDAHGHVVVPGRRSTKE